MIVKALMENTACDPSFQTEHGLSLYIEANGRKILFDTGQSPAFTQNAEKLDVDLTKVDFAVLSHAHYDHGGGLQAFLSRNKTAPVYVSQYAFADYRHGEGRYVGLDKTLEGYPQLVMVHKDIELGEGLELLTAAGYPNRQSIHSDGLTVSKDGEAVPEDFRHEQYLLITENGKRVLISGCSHRGIVNIMHWFQPDVLIGGFHFMNLDPASDGKAALDAATDELLRFDTTYYTCHCTGTVQFDYLKPKLQDRLVYLSTGQVIKL